MQPYGQTALHKACWNDNPETVKLLLKHGARRLINNKDKVVKLIKASIHVLITLGFYHPAHITVWYASRPIVVYLSFYTLVGVI